MLGRRQVQLWLFVVLLVPLYFLFFFSSFGHGAQSSQHAESNVPNVQKLFVQSEKKEEEEVVQGKAVATHVEQRNVEEEATKANDVVVAKPTHRQINEILGYDPNTLPQSSSYKVQPLPECWHANCNPDEDNNKRVLAKCKTEEASHWNARGVDFMLRLVETDGTSDFLRKRYLGFAIPAFQNATALDPSCSQAFSNLAIATALDGDKTKALDFIKQATTQQQNNQNFWAIRGFLEDFNGDRVTAKNSWNKALEIDPFIGERKYFGIMVVNDTRPTKHFVFPMIREPNKEHELASCLDILAYIEFAKVSIPNYARIPPGTQEFFINHKYFIIRDIVPPFVLNAMARGIKNSRLAGSFGRLGDYQSKRFNSLNDRISRVLHLQLVDVWRRIIMHNVIPSYSFYGGYQAGSKLPPHTDKLQCEFTVSLTVNQFPIDQPWSLSLGSRAKFDRDEKFIGDPQEKMPPEPEIVDAMLYPGDALLFMGRHLVHFRRGELTKGRWLDQVFLHHVQDTFPGWLDI